MQRRSLSQLIKSFEDVTGDSIEGSENVINAGAVVDVIDYIEGEDNTNEMQQAALLASKASEELGIFTETNDQLEQFVAEKTELLENGVITGDDVMAANEALAQACALYGIEKPAVCSFEAIGQDPKQALKVALEGIGETISKGFDAIIQFFKKFFAGIWNFIKGLFGSEEAKQKEIENKVNEVINIVNNDLKTKTFKTARATVKNSLSFKKLENKNIEEALEIVKAEDFDDSEEIAKAIPNALHFLNQLRVLGFSESKTQDLSTLIVFFKRAIQAYDVFIVDNDEYFKKDTIKNSEIFLNIINKSNNLTYEQVVDEVKKASIQYLGIYEASIKSGGRMLDKFRAFGDIEKVTSKVQTKLDTLGSEKSDNVIGSIVELGLVVNFQPEQASKTIKIKCLVNNIETSNNKIKNTITTFEESDIIDLSMTVAVNDIEKLLFDLDYVNPLVEFVKETIKNIDKQRGVRKRVLEDSKKSIDSIINTLEAKVKNNDKSCEYFDMKSILTSIKSMSDFRFKNMHNSVLVLKSLSDITNSMKMFLHTTIKAAD